MVVTPVLYFSKLFLFSLFGSLSPLWSQLRQSPCHCISFNFTRSQ